MNDMIENKIQTPIEIALGIDENGMTTASKLYSFLELSQSNYSKWCRANITDNEFAEENIDFVRFVIKYESGVGVKEREDFKLTAHFAKKLSVKGNSAKAEEAREYFTGLEERVKQKIVDISKLPPEMQMFKQLWDMQANTFLEQKRQAEKIEKLENSQKALADTFSMPSDTEDFQAWANKCIARIAESPMFNKGVVRNSRYAYARNESYERLKKKWNCNLDDRVSRAKGRAMERNPGITKAELNTINKLTVIANDKSLRPVYETVLKEMMIQYCVEVPR